MSLFEFLMVFVSIIVGLGVTEILTGIAMQIRHRESIKGYWVHTAGVLLIFVALIQNWWELWDRRNVPEWTFLGVVLMLIPPASLYLVAHLIFRKTAGIRCSRLSERCALHDGPTVTVAASCRECRPALPWTLPRGFLPGPQSPFRSRRNRAPGKNAGPFCCVGRY